MRNSIFITITILFFTKFCFAQNPDTLVYKKNALFLELVGNAGQYSINYEGILKGGQKGFFTLRIGFSYTGEYIFPILLNHVSGHHNNHLEMGAGVRFSPTYTLGDGGIITANVIYRFQKPNGKFLFRAGWTPIFYKLTDQAGLLNYWCGMSIGYLF